MNQHAIAWCGHGVGYVHDSALCRAVRAFAAVGAPSPMQRQVPNIGSAVATCGYYYYNYYYGHYFATAGGQVLMLLLDVG